MIVVPIAGASELMLLLTDALTAVYHLYVEPVTLGPDTVLSSFTEASWAGYAPLKVAKWYPPAVDALPAVDSADPLVWTLAAAITPVTVYGYWVTHGLSGALCWAESAPAGGYVMADAGDCITLIPVITLAALPSATFTAGGRRRRNHTHRR